MPQRLAVDQAPRYRIVPPSDFTWGDLACDLAASYGLAADPWQELVIEDWLAEKDGKWASISCGLSVPRQNGKNAALEIRELFGLIARGEKILHTAHQVKTATKHFQRLKYFFGEKAGDPTAKFPELNALVERVDRGKGSEGIFLKNGGSIEIIARSQKSGRGFTVDVIVCDEAQDMSDDDQEALLSTSSAAPSGNPQWIYTGTPPGPKAVGEVFTRMRINLLEDGVGGRRLWHEWSAAMDDDIDEESVWVATNPGLASGRLQLAVVQGERESLSDEGFRRERLGMWDAGISRSVIPMSMWNEAGDDFSLAVDRFALGVEVAPDLTGASIALAGLREDGRWHIELEEQKEGTAWVVPYIVNILKNNPQIRGVGVDAGSPAKALLEEFQSAGVKVITPKVADLGGACAVLLSGVVAGDVRHVKQSHLTAAVQVASTRKLGDTGMWVWSRKTATSDVTPIQAVTLALWVAQLEKIYKRPLRQRGTSERRAVVL